MDEADSSKANAPPARPGVLLLVDDEENILSSLRRLLRRDGHRILTASSGAQGLEILASESVDVIVSDQRMPEMTGTEFLTKARVLCPDSVRIVLSGYTELESVTSAINEGSVYKFLTKPWEDQQLRDNITEAINHKFVADDNARLHLELQAANEQLEALLEDRKRQLVVGQLSLNFAHETLASLPVAVLGVDNEGMIALANDAAMALFPGVMIGDFFVQAMPAAMHALQAHPCPYRGPCQVDGKPFQVAINPLGSPKKVRGRVISFIDCAEQEAPK